MYSKHFCCVHGFTAMIVGNVGGDFYMIIYDDSE